MNEFLANFFGTAAPAEPTVSAEKVAEAELFAKLAAENGIDLDSMTDDQVRELYNETFKTASDDKDADDKPSAKEEKEDDKDEKKAAAAAELTELTEETKLAQDKFAEATLMGQIMAHSMMRELQSIKEAADKEATTYKAKDLGTKFLNAVGRVGGEKAQRHALGARTIARASKEDVPDKVKRVAEHAAKAVGEGAKHVGKEHGKALAVGAAGVAAGAGGAALANKMRDKKASAITELASVEAVKLAAAEGYDVDEACERVAAVLTLTGGNLDNTKIASAGDVDSAVGIRALELLEAAGYPVEWQS